MGNCTVALEILSRLLIMLHVHFAFPLLVASKFGSYIHRSLISISKLVYISFLKFHLLGNVNNMSWSEACAKMNVHVIVGDLTKQCVTESPSLTASMDHVLCSISLTMASTRLSLCVYIRK